jgi:hypothetical protein
MQQLLIGRYIRNINMIQALRCKLGASLRYADSEPYAICHPTSRTASPVLRLTAADDEPPVALSVDERATIAASKSAAARGKYGL